MNKVVGFIHLSAAHIAWRLDSDGRVCWVGAFFYGMAPPDIYFDGDAGACFADWLSGDPCLTPEGVFIHLEEMGFSSPDVRLNALREFAQIEGCSWARIMAAALEQYRG